MSDLKINDLLGYAIESGSSDLHLSVGSFPMVRINGEMKKLQLPIMDDDTMNSIRDEVLNDNQKKIAEKVLKEVNERLSGKVVTKISLLKNYCPAEEYHQKYLEKR